MSMQTGLFKQRAEWIWRKRGLAKQVKLTSLVFEKPREMKKNLYIYFRKEVEINDDIDRANVYASADGRYQLFVNNQFVGRGPARCYPNWQYIDPYDLKPYLHPGCNVITALVHSYGMPCSWYELPQWEALVVFGCGGFFLQGDIVIPNGETVCLDTDNSWRCLPSQAWKQQVSGGPLGFIEDYDARRVPIGWKEANFDDRGWEAPEILRVEGAENSGDIILFPHLVVRDIPPLLEEIHPFQSILTYGEVENKNNAQEIADQLDQEIITQARQCIVKNIETIIKEDGKAEIITTKDHSISIILDFGKIVSGRVYFDLDGPSGSTVDLTYSERLKNDGRVYIPNFSPRPAHRYTLRDGRQTWEQFEWGGFRYLQLTFRNCLRPLYIHSVRINFTTYPVKKRGSFECSDELLNQIWQTGSYTLQLCMHDGYEDCPSREQRQWIGDAYVESLVSYTAFGDYKLMAKLLRQVAQSQYSDGMTAMVAPGDFSAPITTTVPEFCLYWIMSIDCYVQYSGDNSIVEELYPSIVKAIGWFERFLDTDNLLNCVPHFVWIDWAELDRKGKVTALNAQFVAALRCAAKMACIVNIPHDADRFNELATRITAAINENLWDEERGIYIDAYNQNQPSQRISQQANSAVIAFNVAPRKRWSRIFETILNQNRVKLTRWSIDMRMLSHPYFDEKIHVVMAQPFYAHFLHQAMHKAGLFEPLLHNIRRCWGGLVKKEKAAAFRETWQLDTGTSKCHGWSATPTYDLSTIVLGITPTAPGFKKFQVAPQPVYLDWAKGSFPTPEGDIPVSWQWEHDHFKLTVKILKGTEADIVFPEFDGNVSSLIHNGKRIQGKTKNNRLTVCSLKAGMHCFEMKEALRPPTKGPVEPMSPQSENVTLS